jgi:hypothetical protein
MRIALALTLVLAAAQSYAATISVEPVLAGAFTTDGTFTPIDNFDPANPVAAVLQFDFLVSTGGYSAPEVGFANGVFTVTLENLTPNGDVPGFQPATIPTVDSNGALPGGVVPLLSDLADLAAADLVDILVGVATPLTTNPNVDPRFKFGQTAFNAGSAYVNYSGVGAATISAAFTQVAALTLDPSQAGRYLGTVNPNSLMPSGSVTIGVPEPTTCILAGLALVGAAARRRV